MFYTLPIFELEPLCFTFLDLSSTNISTSFATLEHNHRLKPLPCTTSPGVSAVEASSKLDAGDPPPAPPPGQPAWSGEVSKSAIAEAEANGASTGVSEAAAVPLLVGDGMDVGGLDDVGWVIVFWTRDF